MEFEEFKEIDQVKASEKENDEKGGINVNHENSLNLFNMNNVANIQRAQVNSNYFRIAKHFKNFYTLKYLNILLLIQ